MTAKDMIGKRIEKIEVNGYVVRIVLEDGTCLDYIASDGGYSCWDIYKVHDDFGGGVQMYKAKQISTYKWIYGSLLYLNGIPYIVPDDGDINNLAEYKVEETTVCEHNGLYNNGEEDIWEHDYVKISYRYCDGTDDQVYEVRKEYACPVGCWSQSGFILYCVGSTGFMSFEDTIDSYSNEICVQIVGNKYDDFNIENRKWCKKWCK